MRIFKLKFILLWMFAFFITKPASSHKFHTSLTKMEYNEQTHSWEIIMNVSFHDFEKSLSKFHEKKITIADKEIETLAFSYLKSKFYIKSNNEVLAIKLIGTKQEKDVFKIFFECPQKSLGKSIILSNTSMLESDAEQINIVNIRIKGKTQTAVFQKDQKTKEVKF